MAEAQYRHEEVAGVPRGYHVRTIHRGKHEIRVAYPPGRRVTGAGQLVSILHPIGENPHCHVRNIFLNPTTLERKRATRERAKRIREARIGNPEKPSVERISARSAKVVTSKGHVDYPIRYDDGRIAYDFPERVPAYQKKQVRKIFSKPFGSDNPIQMQISHDRAIGKFLAAMYDPKFGNLYATGYTKKQAAAALREAWRKARKTGSWRNPNGEELEAAERLYEEFHGRAPREILEIEEQAVKRGDFTALGDLVELSIDAPNREHVQIHFKGDGVRLASSPEGNQLWFISGNQDLSRNLGTFGVKDKEKDLLDLGVVRQIVYEAAKWQTGFTPQEWKHDLGEKSGVRPRLFYDQQDREHPKMFLAGGTYKVKSPGIID